MAQYKSFIHVIRLDRTKVDVDMFLNADKLYVFSKLDGSNFCAWADEAGQIHVGSRKREVSLDRDNADSMLWFTTSPKTEKIRAFLVEHPEYVVYMEWLNGWAGRKQAGAIGQYLNAEGWVIAMFDTNQKKYLSYPEYAGMLEGIYDQIDTPLAILDHPKEKDLEPYLGLHFNLPETITQEGIVMWNYDFVDARGEFQVCKIVNEEFLARKGTPKKTSNNIDDVEQAIVDTFITDVDIEKAKIKIVNLLNLIEWEANNRTIGMLMNFVWDDLMNEEFGSIVKVYKFPIVDFKLLKNLVNQRVRKFLGFI